MSQLTSIEVIPARGYRVLSRTLPAWFAFALLAIFGTLFLVHTPPGSIHHAGVFAFWGIYLLSVLAFSRTRVVVDGPTLRVQGRLRRRAFDLADIRQFASNSSGDLWSIVVFSHPIVGDWLWTVTMMRFDGTEEDLPIIGSKRACRDVVVELNRVLRR